MSVIGCALVLLATHVSGDVGAPIVGGGLVVSDVKLVGATALWEALKHSFAMIIVSEIGDKTFFIAAVLAMRHDRLAVLLGAGTALAAMTVLSAAIGLVLPALLPKAYTHWAAVALFVYFAFKLLYEGLDMVRKGEGAGVSDELGEVEQSLKDGSTKAAVNPRAVVMQALTLTFLAEWGDRSQIATIALAAAKEPMGVTLGGIGGHLCCTTLAVLGGRALASRISERAVVIAGGALFLAFAVHGAITGVSD